MYQDEEYSTPVDVDAFIVDTSDSSEESVGELTDGCTSVSYPLAPLGTEQPTLPNGELINSKNTLQTFESIPGCSDERFPLDSLARHPFLIETMLSPTDVPNVAPPEPTTVLATSQPRTVVATAVESEPNIVYAQLASRQGSLFDVSYGDQCSVPPEIVFRKSRRATFALLAILAVSMSFAVGIALFFGLSRHSMNGIITSPTNAPTLMTPTSMNPTLDTKSLEIDISIRTSVLTSFINNITLSDKTITVNGTSPESMALKWMIFNDTTLETAALTSSDLPISMTAVGFSITQCFPLLVMWFQQTELAKWTSVDGWLIEPSECNWFGITCEAMFAMYESVLSATGGVQNVVTRISFNLIHSYVGVIPLDIGLLTNLKHFEITTTRDFDNDHKAFLQGTLPNSIGLWTALTYFDVSSNSLSGTIPDSIGNWTGLTHFDTSDNISPSGENLSLFGTLPSSIGLWTALTYFDISSNFGLTGLLPGSISQWTALLFFSISGDGFYGRLTDSIGQWTALTFFDISSNHVNGTVPSNVFSQWSGLTFFDVGFNDLSGTLPESIGQWTSLTYFDVSDNNMTATIPQSIGNWSFIEYAGFYGNQFTGAMPDAMCQFVRPNEFPYAVDCNMSCTCCFTLC